MEYKPILLLKTGESIPETRQQYGDFEHWFAKGLYQPDLVQVDVFSGSMPPRPEDFAAVIVTGSASMVSHREEWSEETAQWLAHAVHSDLPVLGVCFGHQLLAHALGGHVAPNPMGRQIGTQEIDLLPAAGSDPLMCRLPPRIRVQTTHVETVHDLPEGAVRLATSPMDHNHAFRYGERAWGLQFHPEFGAEVMKGYIRARSEQLRREGVDTERVIDAVTETPLAHGLLSRFAALVGATVGIENRSGRVRRLDDKNDPVDARDAYPGTSREVGSLYAPG